MGNWSLNSSISTEGKTGERLLKSNYNPVYTVSYLIPWHGAAKPHLLSG
jgi:hypothetical protein